MKATDFCIQQAMFQQKINQLTAPIISKQLIADQMHAPVKSFQTWTNQFTEVPQYLRDIQFDRIAQIRKNLTFTSTELPSNIAKCIDSYMLLTDTSLMKTVLLNQRTSFSSTIQYAAAAVAAAQPYIPLDQIEVCPLETLSDLTKNRETPWSIDRIIALLSFLLTLVLGILSSLPNKQLDLLIKQNETLIEQHEEIIKTQEENSELHEVLYALTNSINLLTDEVESLRNESENFDDTSEPESQPNPEDSQQTNRDTHD